MSLHDFAFWCLALFTAGSAIATAATTQIVRAAVWLMFTLAGIAGLYFLLGFEFLGATQLIIYIGGILVLVVFAVMLTAQGPGTKLTTKRWQWIVVALIGIGLFGLLATVLLTTRWEGFTPAPLPAATDTTNSDRIALSLLGSIHGEPEQPLPLAPGQMKHRVHYLFLFEIVSVHLLVVLIGAAYLARAKRRRNA